MAQVWVCSPMPVHRLGEIENLYVHPHCVWMNIQQDYSEQEAAVYGQQLYRLLKLRSLHIPPVWQGDHLYFAKPAVQRTVELDGRIYEDCGQGDYEVCSVTPAAVGVELARNHTVILARSVTKQTPVMPPPVQWEV